MVLKKVQEVINKKTRFKTNKGEKVIWVRHVMELSESHVAVFNESKSEVEVVTPDTEISPEENQDL